MGKRGASGKATNPIDLRTAWSDYEGSREAERKGLSDFLVDNSKIKEAGLTVKTRGRAGKGWTSYTSGGRIAPYDLSNWKWVELNHIERDFTCIVSLNMIETDPKTGNTHCLYDRIGLYVTYPRNGCYYKTDIYMDIDLPLDEKAKDRILELILEQFDFHSYCCSKGGSDNP